MRDGYWYKKEDEEFILMHGEDTLENEVYRCKEVAIAYSGAATGKYELQKHGKPELVQTWFSNLGNKMREAGGLEGFGDYQLIQHASFNPVDLNRLLEESEYITEFVSTMNSKLIDVIDTKNTDGDKKTTT